MRDEFVARAIAEARTSTLAAQAADAGDVDVKLDIDWLSIISAWSWHDVGVHRCSAGCNHRVNFFARHVGFIIGGHRQISCGCRLARQAAESQGRGQGMCGCEWTKDDNYGPISIP